jgi:hypothetical protein
VFSYFRISYFLVKSNSRLEIHQSSSSKYFRLLSNRQKLKMWNSVLDRFRSSHYSVCCVPSVQCCLYYSLLSLIWFDWRWDEILMLLELCIS